VAGRFVAGRFVAGQFVATGLWPTPICSLPSGIVDHSGWICRPFVHCIPELLVTLAGYVAHLFIASSLFFVSFDIPTATIRPPFSYRL
jgi:hypothetical protein